MSSARPAERRPRRRPRSRLPRLLGWLVALLVVFGLGVAVGKALEDGPARGGPQTYVRTLRLPPTTGPVTTFTP